MTRVGRMATASVGIVALAAGCALWTQPSATLTAGSASASYVPAQDAPSAFGLRGASTWHETGTDLAFEEGEWSLEVFDIGAAAESFPRFALADHDDGISVIGQQPACGITTIADSASEVAGRFDCEGLRWLTLSADGQATIVPGMASFDLTLEFAAGS